MSPTGQRLRSTIAAARRRVQVDALWAAVGLVGVVVPAVLVVAWAAGGAATWRDPGVAPLAVELVGVAAAAALGWWLFRRWIAAYDEARAAAAAEETLGLPSGTVRGVLELSRTVPEGTSPALYLRAESEVARHLSATTPAQLTGAAGARARRRRNQALLALAGSVAVVLVLGFASPERASAGWRPLVHPVAHLTPPPMPALEVLPGNARVPRGGALALRVLAKGRRTVAVHWRAAGDVPRHRELHVSGDSAATSLAGIDAPLSYWVTAPDGATSDTFRVVPVDPLLVSDLVVDVIYPSYLNRAAERFDGDVPGLEIPAGTRLRIRGRATRPLASAALVRRDGGVRVTLSATADRFEGAWTPTASGTYDWALVDRSGAAPNAVPGALELMVVPDSAPQVEVLVPATDTTISPDMKQPIAANAWDDHGLRSASLVSWRVSALGQRDAAVEQAIALGGATDHASLETVLDATNRRLLPGDTLHFQIRVTDNSPAGQVGVSRTFTLWIPGMDELRRQAEAQAEALVADATEVAKTAKGLQESTRDLSRRSAASNARGGSSRGGSPGNDSRGGKERSQSPGYERTEQARQLLDRQEALMNQVEELKQRTARLERAMQAAGLQDPELQKRLKELRDLYEQILTPELRQKLQDLKQALADMDQAKLQEALQQLAQQQDEFRKRIDDSLELLRRAAAEQQMNSLAQQAREMATQQKALAEAMQKQAEEAQRSRSPEAQKQREEQARRQAELAQRADSLAKAIDRMRQQLDEQGEQQAAQQTSGAQEKADSARKAMQQAAQQAQQQAQQQASQNGQRAADQLQQAAQQLEQTRKQMSESWKSEVQQAVQQATQEALSLAQRQASLAERMKQAQQGDQPQGQSLPNPPQLGMQKGQSQGQPQGQRPGMQPNGQQSGAQRGGQRSGQQQGGQQGGQQGAQQGGQQGQQPG
ncbi:MAG: hypothetical protein IRZ00_10015, partial [Gemmatimonadetes bacterium]|nr:hypothetical protein [Gemmatimonadota bacterium]